MRIKIEHVHYMPKELKPNVLYVSEEFGTAAHLCACGCGSKVRTPLTPTDWTLDETGGWPSLFPSIGNWQLACRSHYWIRSGHVEWAEDWSSEQIAAGRLREEERRNTYYDAPERQRYGTLQRLWRWVKSLLE